MSNSSIKDYIEDNIDEEEADETDSFMSKDQIENELRNWGSPTPEDVQDIIGEKLIKWIKFMFSTLIVFLLLSIFIGFYLVLYPSEIHNKYFLQMALGLIGSAWAGVLISIPLSWLWIHR